MIAKSLRALSAAALFALVALPAAAQSPPSAASIAAAKEILDLKGANKMFSPLVAGVIARTKDQLLQSNLTLGKDLDEVALKLAGEYNPRASEVMNQAAKFYAQAFTEKEVQDILAFYKSPVGRKVIDTEPKVIDASFKFASDWANQLSLTIIDRFRTEMKKRGHNL